MDQTFRDGAKKRKTKFRPRRSWGLCQRSPENRKNLLMQKIELTPAQKARLDIREGRHTGPTHGLALGYVQCNLVILRKALAFDFLLYCQRNQRACPILEVTDPGNAEPKQTAPGADLRIDLPRYAVYH